MYTASRILTTMGPTPILTTIGTFTLVAVEIMHFDETTMIV